MGEWVDPDAKPEPLGPAPGEVPEVTTDGGWLGSSFDLLNGTDVSEVEDTVPGDLLDELFPLAGRTPKDPAR